ncbi:hypothetical protein F8M41_008277 [Gigaspora margarita]|uniref:Uncharacterized protein n=1 Tax=Gigaspora margarita TaxID=4874 RepID=A0A8H3X588_GIGMA|nr:hypothetical protein F8M41_008277 [Gigaspora margarita]
MLLSAKKMIPKKRKPISQSEPSLPTTAQYVQQSQSSTQPIQQSTSQPVAYEIQQSPTVIPDLNTVLNYLDHHIYYDRPTTFVALRTRFDLLTNNLVNDGVDAMLNVLFPNTTRRSRSSTPSLPENFSFEDFEDWSYSPPSSAEARDNYENELLKDGLNLPRAYFENGNFPCVPRRAHDVPVSFTKSGRTMTSVQLCDYYKTNNVIVIYLN